MRAAEVITPPCWGKGSWKPRVLMQQQKWEEKQHIWELSSAVGLCPN